MNLETQQAIVNRLEDYSSLFHTFWDYCEFEYSTKIPTAAIIFGTDLKPLKMLINEQFFESLNLDERVFIIAHELLHILLNHGNRTLFVVENKKYDKKCLNVAQDIFINESLLRQFGFSPYQLPTLIDDMCKVDNCFPTHIIHKHMLYKNLLSSEQYYALLQQHKTPEEIEGLEQMLLDSHEMLEALGDILKILQELKEANPQEFKEVLEKINEKELIDAKEQTNKISEQKNDSEVKDGQKPDSGTKAGTNDGTNLYTLPPKIKEIKKWSTLFKKATARRYTDNPETASRWDLPSRRYDSFLSTQKNMFLPTEHILEPENPKVPNLLLFVDVSGSCTSWANKFFQLVKTINLKQFKTRFFAFDTKIVEFDIRKTKTLQVGGGTYFHIIQEKIDEIMKDSSITVDGVVIVTDGEGNSINIPQDMRSKYHWILTPNNTKMYVPTGCVVHEFKDFLSPN